MSDTSKSKSPQKEAEQQQHQQSQQQQVDTHSPDGDEHQMDDGRDSQNVGFGYGEFEIKEQDRWLPIANVARIMKGALPENAKIAKEAKECMQECVSEFISFITSEASEKCHQEKRKTVNGEDILFAMTSLGFENYSEALKIYLSKYRDVVGNHHVAGGSQGEQSQPPSQQAEQARDNSNHSTSNNNNNRDPAVRPAYMSMPASGGLPGGESNYQYTSVTGQSNQPPS